jgi:hypothetical protein
MSSVTNISQIIEPDLFLKLFLIVVSLLYLKRNVFGIGLLYSLNILCGSFHDIYVLLCMFEYTFRKVVLSFVNNNL